MRLAAQLPHGLDDLGHAAAVGRMVVAQAAAVGVDRQPADAGDQVAVGDELAAFALPAEAEVLELHQHGDGEAVVDRGVLDVLRRDARGRERRLARPDRARKGEIDVAAELAPMTPTSGRPRVFATSGRVSTSAPPPSLITQQSSRCSGSATIGEFTTSSTVTSSRSMACGLCWA